MWTFSPYTQSPFLLGNAFLFPALRHASDALASSVLCLLLTVKDRSLFPRSCLLRPLGKRENQFLSSMGEVTV